MQYMLDTNICIHIAKRRPPQVLSRFQSLPSGSVVMSAVTYGELYFGSLKSSHSTQALQNLKSFTAAVPALSLDDSTARYYAQIRLDLQQQGQIIGTNDLWIAAHCLHLGLTLVTNNEREFQRVSSLKLENWTK